MLCRLGGFVFAVALLPGTARAQTAQSLEELQRILQVRQTVVVTDASGQKVKGRIDQAVDGLHHSWRPNLHRRSHQRDQPARSVVERDAGRCGHRDGTRDVGLHDRSERTWKRRDICRRYRSWDRDRRRHRRLEDKGGQAALCVASPDGGDAGVATARKKSTRRASSHPFLIGTGRLRLHRSWRPPVPGVSATAVTAVTRHSRLRFAAQAVLTTDVAISPRIFPVRVCLNCVYAPSQSVALSSLPSSRNADFPRISAVF